MTHHFAEAERNLARAEHRGHQRAVEAERRVSPVLGLSGDLGPGGSADQRVLGQASVEW